MAIERTISIIKPDAVAKNVIGEIYSRFEQAGLRIVAAKMAHLSREQAEAFYAVHQQRPFFNDLVTYICSGPVVAMVWSGPGVVASARKLIGATNPLDAEPGTIRGDLAVQTGRNVVHGSDSPDNGAREAALWFGGGQGVVEWELAVQPWLTE